MSLHGDYSCVPVALNDSKRLHDTADKVEAMVRAPIPKNVQEMRSSKTLKLLSEVLSQFGLSAATSELSAATTEFAAVTSVLTATARMQMEMDSRMH